MTTSSAEPARLEAYPSRVAEVDEQLTTVVNQLDSAMARFATGSHAYLPSGFDQNGAGDLVRGIRDESQHLARWVASVGAAFREAGSDRDGDGIFEAQDELIADRVGEATIAGAQAEARGRQAARDLQDLLEANGIDPSNFTPEELNNLVLHINDPRVRALYEQMQAIGENMWEPAYASGFYDELGTEGIRTTLGVVDTFAYLEQSSDPDWLGSAQHDLLAPLATGWALATRSPDTADERAGILDTRDHIEQRHLALLMSGPPNQYDPEWLADGAERILVTGRDLNGAGFIPHPDSLPVEEYPAYGARDWLYGDPALGVNQVIAARALDGNADAGLDFLERGQDHIHALAYPDPVPMVHNRNFHDVQELQNDLESYGAGVIEAGVTHEDPAVRRPIMEDVIEVVVDEPQRLNEHMYAPLAAGVEQNMELIHDRINSGWSPDGESYTFDEDDRTMPRTQDFLTELMADGDARNTIRDATSTYVQGQLDHLPADTEGAAADDRDHALNELGRVFGVVADADIAAVTEQFEEAEDGAAASGRIVDYVISWTPLAPANDLANVVEANVGQWIAEGLSPDDAEFQRRLRNLLIAERQGIEGQDLPSDDLAQMRRGADDAQIYSD